MKIKNFKLYTGVLLALHGASVARGFDLHDPPVNWPAGAVSMQIRLGSSPGLSDGTNYTASVQAAMQTWNAVLGSVQFAPQVAAPGAASNSSNNVNEIVFSDAIEGSAFGDGVLAVTLTSTFTSINRIAEADILFNTAYVWDSFPGGQLAGKQDIRRVAIHELGHVLGLGHPDEAGQSVTAIMNSHVSYTPAIDTLQADDIAGAQALYTPPANNNFASATELILGNNAAFGSGTNYAATKEAGEPNHAGDTGGASLWWKWTAPSSGAATITTLDSTFDTLLAAYTESSVSALNVVASNDDVQSGVIRTSSITFTATAGATYFIAVDGWDGAVGTVALHLTFAPAVTNAPPVITGQPTNQSANAGQTVQFTVSAAGVPAPSYQWQRQPAGVTGFSDLSNGGSYSGANSAMLTVSGTTLAMSGDQFRIIASNTAGSTTSSVATLTVAATGPIITGLSQARQVFAPGQSMNISVAATGSGTITYQWIHNGRIVLGATDATLSKPSFLPSDGGWYVVLLTDSNGTRRSAPIFVTVISPQTQVRAWGTSSDGIMTIPVGLTSATAISAGGTFALALKSDGTVVSWGSNAQGQGNIPAGLNEIVAVSAGYGHALALKSDGTVRAWGGAGFTPLINVPAGLSGVVAIAATNAHSLALKSDGTVVGWGQNIYGEAVAPVGLTNVVAISAGFEFSIALKSDGTVVAWGDSGYGKTSVPAGLSGVVAIAAGDAGHTLALKSDGTVVAWGRSNEGQTNVPSGLNHVVKIAAGERHSAALRDDGTIVVWGNLASVPADLSGGLAVSSGFGYSLALCDGSSDVPPAITTQPANTVGAETSTATLSVVAAGAAPLSYQWRKGGVNISGATSATLTITDLGLGDAGNYDVVVSNYLGSVTSAVATLTVNPIPVITGISAGSQVVRPGQTLNLSVTAIGTGSLTYQWMHNGQPIPGATSSNLVVPQATAQTSGWYLVFITDVNGTRRGLPIRVLVVPASNQVRAWSSNSFWVNAVPADLTNVLTISAGQMALRQNGTVIAWGNSSNGQDNVPAGLNGVVAIAGGNSYGLAVKGDGTVVGWGSNNYGAQLVPAGLTGVVDVSIGYSHAVALKSNGRVVAWGQNTYNQTNIPGSLKNVFTISAGAYHALAVKDDGTVAVWGDNGSGQLQVPAGLNNVVAVAGGYAHSMALKSDGTVVAWGSNSYGETNVPAGLNGVIAVAAARYHSLALKADGTVIAWGSTSDGNTAAPGDLAGVYAIADGTGYSLALRDATGESAPAIISQPVSQSLAQGQRATFTVMANGAGTLAYQWRKNGVNIAGATSASFMIDELVSVDAGNYDVVVANYIGSTTSATVMLTVNPPAVITSLSPTRQVLIPGQNMNLSVTATGVGALSYQWTRNGRPIDGATGSTYAVTGVSYADTGWYLVSVTDSNGTKRSAPIFLTVAPLVTEIRAWGGNGYNELAIPAGLNDVIAIAAGDVTALALKRDGTVVAWGTDWRHGGNTTIPVGLNNVVAIAAGPFQSLALKSDGTVVSWGWYNSGIQPPPAGLNNVVAIAANERQSIALKSNGSVVIWGNIYNRVPAGLTNVVNIAAPGSGSTLALKNDGTIAYWNTDLSGQGTVPAGFTNVTAISSGPNHSLGLKNDGTVVGWEHTTYAHNATVVPAGLGGVVAIDAGDYHSLALKNNGTVVAWGDNDSGQTTVPADLANVFAISAGTWFSVALRDASSDSRPVITTQPVSQTRAETATAIFSVTATGPGVFSYQWLRNGSPINGASSAALTLANLRPTDAGNYQVVVTNHVGSTTSGIANLTVNPIAVVTNQSASRQVFAPGQTINLSVSATGTGVLTYQWYHNNRAIPGATDRSLSLPGAGFAENGAYVVQVSDNFGTRRSSPMFVIVAPSETRVLGWGDPTADAIVPPAGLSNAVAIAMGSNSAFALKRDGSVVSWGQGSRAPEGLTNIVSVAATYHGGIVLRGDGTVATWNWFWSDADVPPAGLSNVISISAGANHYLALKSDGTVVAWGGNPHGETNVPVGLTNVVAITGGYGVSLAIKADGALVAWGDNSSGQATVPPGLSNVIAADGSYPATFALKSDGTVVAWGSVYASIAPPAGLGNVAAISAGTYHVIALKPDGTVAAWGRNEHGETNVPTGLAGVFAISAEDNHSLALRDATPVVAPSIAAQPQNQVSVSGAPAVFTVQATSPTALSYQWQVARVGSAVWSNLTDGTGSSGSLTAFLTVSGGQAANSGDQYRAVVANEAGSVTSEAATLTVVGPGYAKISAGRYHSLRLDITPRLFASGTNAFGQLGNGTTTAATTPQQIFVAGQTIADIAAGAQHSLILTNAKELWATGFNGNGQLGDGTLAAKSTPVRIATGVAGMAAAVFHSAFIKTDGTLWTMGGNDSGQLGNGTTIDRATPTQVAANVVHVALGNRQSFFLKADGTLWGMGDMNGSGVPVSTPVQIATNVTTVSVGAYHGLFIKADGTLWSLGYNAYGQLGNGTTTDSTIPVQIATGVRAAAAGYFHSAFVKNDNTLWTVGYNSGGQLGDGTTTSRSTPFQMATNVASVSASESYTLFTKNDGTLWASGYNAYGQFGNGGTATTNASVQISTGAIPVPAAPSGLSANATPSFDRVRLLWQPAADAPTYEVWRNTTNDSVGATRIAQNVRWAIYDDLSVANGQAFCYWIKAVNPSGASVFGPSAFVSLGNETAPSITTQPASQTLTVGSSVTFSVVASSTTPLTYQWRKGSVNIAAANSASYSITSAATTDAGSYSVVVTNSAGSVASASALLTVNKLSATVTLSGLNPTYDGTPKAVTVSTVPAGLNVTTTYFGSTEPPVRAGNYFVEVTVNDPTYSGGADAMMVIAKANPVLTWRAPAAIIYGTPISSAQFDITANLPGELTTSPQAGGIYPAGTTALTASFRPADIGNYNIASATNSLTINMAEATIAFSDLNHVFDQTPKRATVRTTPVGLFVSTAYNGSISAFGAGSYNVVGTIVDHNYFGSGTATLVVAKADQVVDFPELADRDVGDAPFFLSASARSANPAVGALALPVSFRVVSGPARIDALPDGLQGFFSQVTLTGSGLVTIRASQSGGANYNPAPDVDRTFVVRGNFASWQREKFTATELADASISGPNADPDGDDLSNLTEYALGLEPRQANTTGLPENSAQGADWVYTYSRPSDRADLTYAVEVSTDLATWTTTGVTLELVTTANGTETWRARFPLSGGTTVFFRLKITRP